MRMIRMFGLALSFALPALVSGQNPTQFEVASIRPAADQGQQVEVGLTITGSQARFGSFSLKDYIAMAHDLKVQQVVGPEWLSAAKFNIAATIPEGGKPEQVGQMLQGLLAERFRMKTHREKKEFPVYVLEVAKGGLKMKETAPESEVAGTTPGAFTVTAGGSGAGGGVNLGNGQMFTFGDNKFEGKKLSMASLAEMLSRFTDRTVIDRTGLKGGYDFVLEVPPQDYMAMLIRSAVTAGIVLPPQALRMLEGASTDSLANALEKHGVTLASRREALDIIVVDSMEKTPTEN